jgi:hypothetical protein
MLSTMWKLLLDIPPACIEKVVVAFQIDQTSLDVQLAELRQFAWLHFLNRIQGMFPKLRNVTSRLEGTEFVYRARGSGSAPYLEVFRRHVGIRDLEAEGTLSITRIPEAVSGLVIRTVLLPDHTLVRTSQPFW